MIEATKEDEGLLRQILSSFSCNKDEDIENFLHSRAVEFESLSKARTYLICDENQLMETNFLLRSNSHIWLHINCVENIICSI